ncbi:hypothetical protein vBBceHLY2_00067 [Bacillus phage vB_BceH_LY2]|nr:hypothetical protein vBBceHLY2_00067 [Bacillus phage vB_BceH_LY2]
MIKPKGYKIVSEKKLKRPFRGYIVLEEGKYSTSVYVTEVKKIKGWFGKEENCIEYTVVPDVGIPYPHVRSTIEKPIVVYIESSTVECEGFKQALRVVTDMIIKFRENNSVLGWDRDVDWDSMELNKDLY